MNQVLFVCVYVCVCVWGGGISNEPWCSGSYVHRAALLVMNQGSPSPTLHKRELHAPGCPFSNEPALLLL
jgi:hypothetical protein